MDDSELVGQAFRRGTLLIKTRQDENKTSDETFAVTNIVIPRESRFFIGDEREQILKALCSELRNQVPDNSLFMVCAPNLRLTSTQYNSVFV